MLLALLLLATPHMTYHGGKVLPAGYCAAARELADARQLAMHLDGARLWNAAVKQGVPPRAIAQDLVPALGSVPGVERIVATLSVGNPAGRGGSPLGIERPSANRRRALGCAAAAIRFGAGQSSRRRNQRWLAQ